MDTSDSFPSGTFWHKDSFRIIKPEDFKALGIDENDAPLGTFPALKHPSHLSSKFGGNAYGFGLFEVYDRLRPKDIKLIQSISFDSPEDIKRHYKELNEIYKKIGLLIRFSSLGKPYYLIPVHLISSTLSHIKSKVDEITKIVGYHRKKYLKEYYDIGLLTHQDDLCAGELTFRFKEHRFVVLDSIEKLRSLNQTLDLVIVTRDIYEIILMKDFGDLSHGSHSKKRLDQHAIYILWQIYNLLKPDGEIFVIADHYTPRTNQTTKLVFKTTQEEKNFVLFTHMFKTKKRYKTKDHPIQVNLFDFQKYLGGHYVEQEVLKDLLGGKNLEDMSLEEMNSLPYFNFQLSEWPLSNWQEKVWPGLLSIFFDKIFLKPLIPQPIKEDWENRFSFTDYFPNYMIIYLGQKKELKTSLSEVKRDVMDSNLIGCPTDLLADYRNSFEYVIRTLRVLEKLKGGHYKGLPQTHIDRLKQPLENKDRRFPALNDVIRLTNKIGRLEQIMAYLNPDNIEGPNTKVLENLEILNFFGFSYNELRELVLIVLGHTPLGRIISGKMNEKSLKPLSDLARSYDQRQAINLLRYCLLMTMAETEASRGSQLKNEESAELFDIYESAVRIITNRDLDWDSLLDEKTTSAGGIHNRIVRKLLMMMNYFEFLDNWSELSQKGQREKEALADYDDLKLSKIENVIKLVDTIDKFEEMYLKFDPLQLPALYRKFLEVEFHGTGHIFERIDSQHVFILLWIAVNLAQGEIINYNPILADVDFGVIDERLEKIELETRSINISSLDLPLLEQFRQQLYQNGVSFIVGTGFQIRVDPKTQGLEIAYMDIDKNIDQLKALSRRLAGRFISEIATEELKNLEGLFFHLESFYQSHIALLNKQYSALKLPARQKRWFQEVQALRQYLRANFTSVIFRPEDLHTDLDLLYQHAPSLLNFVLPEFTALQDLDYPWHLYMTSPVTHYIITATKKFQALIRDDKESFQDIHFLHTLAQKEFGPMATGIVGITVSQIEELELIIQDLRPNRPLFDALIKSFIFQDVGRIPRLRDKYKNGINPADLGWTGSFFIEKEKIAEKYHVNNQGKAYLIFLVRHHSLLHHIVRGEFSFYAIQNIFELGDKYLFDAFFVFSFIMLVAIRQDLLLEDLADRLFQIRVLCDKIIDHETTFESELNEGFLWRGNLFCALERYQREGLPEGVPPSRYLESESWEKLERSDCIRHGKMIFAMERMLRLRGIRYVEFLDLVNFILKVPLKFAYKKRRFASIGYATYEKEVFEAFRVYNTLQNLNEETRNFILENLVDDKVRIFGYEKVSSYLSYENQIKLLLVGLLGSKKFRPDNAPICINFLSISEKIEKRYEAINDYLNTLLMEKLWGNRHHLNHLFKAKTGLLLKKEEFLNVLSIDFQDRVNISHKISYMDTINNVEQLKSYFHYSLRSLRRHPFYTDDYELQLEKAFEKRLTEITDTILMQAKKQMDLINDFSELYKLVSDLLDRSWDIGFSGDQKQRLNDLYELRKDSIKREKLSEIDTILERIHDIQELKDYWESVKWYLQSNRRFFGKEIENLIARKFDEVTDRIEAS